MSMEDQMKQVAKECGVEPTEYLPRIAKARETMKIGINRCPCAPNDDERGCISGKCMNEILEKGHCHCNAFRRKKR